MNSRRAFPWLIALALATESCSRQAVATSMLPASRHVTYSFSIPHAPDSASVELYVPPTVISVHTVIAFVARSVDQYAFDDRDWRSLCARLGCALLRIQLPGQGTPDYEPRLIRDAAAGGGEALLKAIAVAATHTAHPEIANAKLILFGHSAAGSFVVTFASHYPDRVLGFIRYHSVPLTTPIDTGRLAQIPALTIVGARDAQVGVADSRTLWQAMRTHQAPWAYVSHVAQPHFSVDGLIEAGSLMRGWIEGIIQRSSRERRPATEAAWLVDDTSAETAPVASFVGGKDQASWLPSAATAIALKRLAGVCKAAPLAVATEILGPSARLVSETVNNCRYSSDSLTMRDLVLALTETSSAADALARTRPSPERSGVAVPSVGEGASYSAFPLRQQQCSSLNAARLTFLATVSLCGPAVGSIADTAALNPIARRLLGAR